MVEEARRVGNDEGAYEELYRRHENAARNVARHILRSRQDADDVVNESFAGVIAAISNGAGPRTNFRQYLMACVRNSCKSRRWCGGAVSTDPSVMEESGVCFEDPDRLSEQGLVASAFSSLSPDWQLTLWLTAVEERPTSEVAEQLGRRPGAVAALAHRAREAFAEAYLAQHQARNTSPACVKISPKLAHYVRGHAGDVDTVLVERHLVNCIPCACAVDELRDLNASLRTLTGPAPLLGAGLVTAGAGAAAMLGGVVPLATAGGWSIGAVSGAAIAKVVVVGALLVPAAVLVSSDSSRTAAPRAAAAPVGAVTVHDEVGADPSKSSPSPVLTPAANGAVSEPAAPAAGGVVGATSVDGDLAITPGEVEAPSAAPLATAEVLGAVVPPAGEALPTLPSVTPPGVPSLSIPPVNITVPVGSGTGGVTLGVDSTGVAAGVDVTVPILGGGAVIDITAGTNGVNASTAIDVPVVDVPVNANVSLSTNGASVSVGVNGTTVISVPPVTVPAVIPAILGSLPSVPPTPVTLPALPCLPILGAVLPNLLCH